LSDEAFCYLALIRDRERLPALLSLLPDARRNAMQELLKKLGNISAEEARNRWKQMREQEVDDLCNRAAREAEMQFELMPPFLQEWICERARNR
jgi:HEAT repeat protein